MLSWRYVSLRTSVHCYSSGLRWYEISEFPLTQTMKHSEMCSSSRKQFPRTLPELMYMTGPFESALNREPLYSPNLLRLFVAVTRRDAQWRGSSITAGFPPRTNSSTNRSDAADASSLVRRRGSHIFWTIHSQMTVKLSSLRAGRPLSLICFRAHIWVNGCFDPPPPPGR
jgi:hypothetical protein